MIPLYLKVTGSIKVIEPLLWYEDRSQVKLLQSALSTGHLIFFYTVMYFIMKFGD